MHLFISFFVTDFVRKTIIELIRALMGICIVAKFGTDWSTDCRCYRINIVKYGKFSNSRADNSDSSGPINSIIELIQALVVIYILTKFGDDWLIFVDARVLTSKLWTDGRTSDGRTVNDHNSSLSTPSSGELKTDVTSSYRTMYATLQK